VLITKTHRIPTEIDT